LEAWLDAWETAYLQRYGKRPSANRVRTHETALSDFYGFLFKREYTDSNPMDRIQRPAKPKSKRGDWLTEEEFSALLEEPVTPQEKIIVAIYAWTAARAGEILTGVTQGDVNLGAETISIRKSKTQAGERVIPIPPELRNAIEDWLGYLQKMGLRNDRLPLLVTKHRTAMYHQYAWRVLKRVAGRAGVRVQDAPDKAGVNVSTVTLHTLRRTLSHHLLNGFFGRDPVRIEVVKALCGHDDVRTTLLYYAEVEQATMAQEIRKAVG
jgi:integrase